MKKQVVVEGVMKFVCLIFAAVALSGCWKVGPDYVAPDLSAFHGTKWKACTPMLQPESTAVHWWTQFNDAELERLVDTLLTQNFSLKIARARIIEARAQRGVSRADLLPKAYLGGYGLRTRAAEDAQGLIGVPGGIQTNLFAGAALASWELDLWGRVQRLVEAADSTIEANRAAYGDAAVSLVAELALAYVDLRTLESRIRILERKMLLLKQQAQLTGSRFNAGTGTRQDYLQAQTVVRQEKAQLHAFIQAKAVAENSIAVLLGMPPSEFSYAEGCQLAVPVVAGMDVPASLLSRRPDVRQAEQEYAAAVARIGAAEGERYPKISLGGVLSFQSTDFEKLLHADTLVYTFGAGIWAPVFTGGRIDAQVAVQESLAEQRKFQLQQTVVEAVAEVENSAVGIAETRRQVAELSCAMQELTQATALAGQLFAGGLASKDTVVARELEQIEIEDALVVASQQELGEVIHLYRALGGGWDVAQNNSKAVPTNDVERIGNGNSNAEVRADKELMNE
ncbi:efflux transporter outer membrane subunit [Halodesulfovibrio marinisediminis]|uniref:Efflux transporter, outer membrane factor (OMF) lipoprotein, NodT family n=1 Tax=Halodesulfovibrio marinisediminis DSM 17456 TaxID=1121457 RepID=A0A1N6JAE4_9BACT|nr:efflux transporter outer membrane subunit [Halodesulfovibrio marinisediminis]SIO41109.1 efflux transporter, outer membrane factor (OMF) lipoprotein, NodT family [Halodesulfovibrio marinisediminis DSM 17456]